MSQKMGPLAPDHPLLEGVCSACQEAFFAGQFITLIPVGPGSDEEERHKARTGRPYIAVALPVHWSCATGEDDGIPS